LYFGDNLKVLDEEIGDGTVDLVYLDPPFNSSATYNVLFAEKSGERSAAQIAVFEDTWHWGTEAEAAYHETIHEGGKVADLLQAFRAFLGQNDMMAYLVMMAPRLKALWQALKPGGGLYLHCDPLPETLAGCRFWSRKLSKRDSLEAHECAQRQQDLEPRRRSHFLLHEEFGVHMEHAARTAFDGLHRIEV
jgi:hypothetical protein